MFGFLSAPCSSCLGSGAHQVYRSHFCGLCNRLRGDYGLWSRWLINRDSTFLSLLGAAQQPACPEPVCTTCCNPFGKKRELHQNGAAVDYAAAITICGLAVKLQDDIEDERRFRRWSRRFASSFLTASVAKAKAVLEQFGFPAESVRDRIREQQHLEQIIQSQRPHDFESAGNPTAESYSQIMEYTGLLPNALGENALPLKKLGRSLGLLIYWFDAWEDYEADLRRGRFNPLQFATRNRQPKSEDRLAAIRPLLQECQRELAALVQELRLYRYQDLIQWISITGVRTKLAPFFPAVLMSEIDDVGSDEKKRRRRRSDDGEESYSFCCCDGCDCACCACHAGAIDGDVGADGCCDCCDGCSGCDCG